MDMMDVFALSGLEWIFGKVEHHFGRAIAWFVTVALAALVVTAVIMIVKRVL